MDTYRQRPQVWKQVYGRVVRMDWCSAAEYAVIALLVIQLIRLVRADADLTLLWKESFGNKPAVLRGQVVWITGASSGIGEYLAYVLARSGCKLILSARREHELNRVKKQCLVCGPLKDEDVLVLPLDITLFDTHAKAVRSVIQHFDQIDILVNNSGRSQRGWAQDTSLQVIEEMLHLNVLGTLSLTKAVLPHMIGRKAGHIVVTNSVAGKLGAPFSAAYSATKFALQGWFDSLRLEVYANNISISNVCPGPVVSEVRLQAFTDKPGEFYGSIMKQTPEKLMSTERCAELMAIAIANKLDETWIALHPVLFFTYVSQYMPSIASAIGKRMGHKMLLKIREGKV